MGAIHLDGLEHPTSNKHAPSADTPSSDSDVKASGSKSSSSNNDVKESGLISSSPSDSKTPTHNEGNAASEDEPDIKLGPLRTAAILLGLSFSIFIIGLVRVAQPNRESFYSCLTGSKHCCYIDTIHHEPL
jgi:hypothetical protein